MALTSSKVPRSSTAVDPSPGTRKKTYSIDETALHRFEALSVRDGISMEMSSSAFSFPLGRCSITPAANTATVKATTV